MLPRVQGIWQRKKYWLGLFFYQENRASHFLSFLLPIQLLIYISSSCRATSTDIPGPFSPPYRPLLPAGLQDYILCRQRAFVCRFLLVVLLCSSMWRGPQEYVIYEFVPTSQAVSWMYWIVFVMGGKWPYSCWFVGCYLHDLFNIARIILV